MRRRAPRRHIAAIGTLTLLGVVAIAAGTRGEAAQQRGEPDRPNVLVVMTDDQRASDLATAMPKTINRVGGTRGVTFEQAWVTFPLCCPSRASYVTGLYAHNHGVRSNERPHGGARKFRDTGFEASSVAVALDRAGYRTGWIGKYLNGYQDLAAEDPHYIPPGYDVWSALTRPGKMYDWTQLVRGRFRTYGRRNRDYLTDVLARQAKSFIKRSAATDKPFFLTVMPTAPHGESRAATAKVNPRPALRHRGAFSRERFIRTAAYNEADISDKPPAMRERPRLSRDQRRQIVARFRDRLASLLAVDDMVKTLTNALRRSGVLENTVIVFTSDNGMFLGEHRLRGKDAPYREAGHVPLLVRGPGFEPGITVDESVANIDVPATIYDVTGVEPLLEPDGVSLLDVIDNPAAFEDRALVIQTQESRSGLRTSDFLYSEPRGTNEVEFYDTRRDPLELESVHGDPAYLPALLVAEQRLDDLRACSGADCNP